ncbi:MAG TPA: hypothetical protein PLR06_12325 [Cyclobacteriaceae bacterium]|nr:hypothetical protein [Cyclobacteriaceae bacterium]
MRNRILVFIGLLFLGSCVDTKEYDLDTVTITPTMAVPLASGELSVKSILSDKDAKYLKVYSDGLLYLQYADTLHSKEIRNLFNPADSVVSTASVYMTAATLPPTSVDFRSDSIVQPIDLNLNPALLTEMGIKSGTLKYTLTTTPSLPNLSFAINMILTDIVDPVTQVPVNIMASGNGSKSLQNYKIRLLDNKFNVKLVFIVKKHTSSVFIPPGAKVNIRLSFKTVISSYVKGFFGDRTVNILPREVDLTAFSSSLKKSPATFVQPLVKLDIANDNGVPTELSFSNLSAKKTGSTLPMLISPSSPVTLNYPIALGNSATTSLSVSNASALINFLPTQLAYTGSIRINKGLSSGNNFLSDKSEVRVALTAEVPLYGRASGMVMADTLKIDFGSLAGPNINTASMKISAVNQLPLDAYIQLYFADKNYVIQDSLLSSNQTYLVKGSSVSGSGDLQAATNTDSKIELNTARINTLFSSTYLIIKSRLNTVKDPSGTPLNVKFKTDYKLKLNVGLNAKMKMTLQ